MLLFALPLAVSLNAQQAQVIATGLQGPQKILLTPGGNILVTETSTAANSGRISMVNRAGTRRTLFDKMPSGTEVTGGGSGPTALAISGSKLLYVAIGGGDAERRGTTAGTSMHNPEGISSPVFTSVLRAEFSADIDSVLGTFTLTPAHQMALADGGEVTIQDGSGATVRLRVLADLPDSTPDPRTVYRFSNPWGLALNPDGSTLFLADASTNALVRIDTATGRWSRFVRFAPAQNPTPVGPPVIEAVPTNVRWHDQRLLTTFLTGFPFVPGRAQVLSVNPETGQSEPFIVGLSSAVDISVRTKSDGSLQFHTLEFSQNQSATPAGPGRLRRYDSWQGETVLSDLRAPTSLAYDPSTRELYILELTGRLLKLQLD
jgi:DNA-binding beta-propeller fold protein YncE